MRIPSRSISPRSPSPRFPWLPRGLAPLALALAIGPGAAGCTPMLNASLRVDGQPFIPTACRSGEAFGFPGVDLLDASGRRLRLVQRPDGLADVHFFPAGAPVAGTISACGQMWTERQSSRINMVYNVFGHATLQCSNAGSGVDGTIEFKNCH